ncbi:MAG: hypothetical protein WBD22_05815 [Pyrinomonadaceae bacterium]
MNTKDINRNLLDDEYLDKDEARVRELLGGLQRVGAPSGFDFGVKAKIASVGRTAEKTRWRPASAVLASLASFGLIMAAAGTFFWWGGWDQDNQMEFAMDTSETTGRVIVPNETPASVAPTIPNDAAARNLPVEAVPQENDLGPAKSVTVSNRNSRPASVPRRTVREKSGGSFDTAIEDIAPILPRGIQTEGGRVVDTAPSAPPQSHPVGRILSQIGIDAEQTETGWKVRSIAAKSLAARAGVAAGDVIEAIGDNSVAGNSALTGTVKADKITLRRNGTVVQVDLRQ